MGEDRQARLITGKLAQVKEVFELVNTVGLGSFIAIGVVLLVTAWLTGYAPTPWVSHEVFTKAMNDNNNLHVTTNVWYQELSNELKAQTLVQKALLCEHKKADDKLKCYKDLAAK